MKFKCTHSVDGDFTVGEVYCGELVTILRKPAPYGMKSPETFIYSITTNSGIKITSQGLENYFAKFEIVKEEENMLSGLEAIKLMEQGKVIIDETGQHLYRIVDGNVNYKAIDGKVWRVGRAFNFNLKYKEYKAESGWKEINPEGESYVISSLGDIYCWHDISVHHANEYGERANLFSSRKKAEEIDFKQTLMRKLQRYSDMNGGTEIDWNDLHKPKHYICYDQLNGELSVSCTWRCVNPGTVYFTSREVAKIAIESYKSDLMKYYKM